MSVKIQLRRGTQSEFSTNNPTLLEGEVAVVTDDKKIIIGPGAFNALDAAGKFINYHTDQGLGTVGGSNATSEIPIKLVGASGQAVAALQVLKNGGSNGILEVFTDNTTELVKINAADGAVDDISLLLKAKASQTAAVLEVQDSGDTTPRFQVKEEGQTLIDPNDTTDPSLRIKKSSGSQSNGILRVNEGGTAEFQVLDGGISVAGTSALEGNVTGKAITTIQNGADDTDRVVIKGLASGNVIETFEDNVSKFKVEATGAVTSEAKGTFADAEIDVSGRTLVDTSVMRRDEIVDEYQAFKMYHIDSNIPAGASSTLKIRKFTSTDGNPLTFFNLDKLSSTAVVTSSGSAGGTEPDMADTPGSSVFPAIKLAAGETMLLKMELEAEDPPFGTTQCQVQLNRYSSDSLASGVRVLIREETVAASSYIFTHAVLNNGTTDFFIAVSTSQTVASNGAGVTCSGQALITKSLSPALVGLSTGATAFEITTVPVVIP